MIKLKGIAASGGISIGKACLWGKAEYSIPKRKISPEDVSKEIYRLEEALIQTRREISSLQKKISREIGFDDSLVFEAHLLVLEDRLLIEDIIHQIKNKKVNVEYAFSQSIKKYTDALTKLNDEYLRERAIDIEDIARRVLRKLLKYSQTESEIFKEKVIIVAQDLTPSETASLPKDKILGFITDVGGITSHTAIIARSLGIPAVVGLEVATKNISSGNRVIIDGTAGLVIVNPSQSVIKEYEEKSSEYLREKKTIHIARTLKACTLDKREVMVSANIELPEEIPLANKYGAEGIGLYRTEYIFLGRKDLPSEEEQYQAYVIAVKKVKPHAVIFRTIDIGGDKFLSRPDMPSQVSPFLGWRAIRFCLARPDIFKTQLRALLRASAEGKLKIMFPMISGIEELKKAKAILKECQKELTKEGKNFDKNISVGTMIEVPSAALTADILAKESDFFSIGTNDLIQYALAVDRINEKVAYLYEPGHPAVINLIKQVIDSGHKNNISVGMCGEMASEPFFAFLLLGLGLDEFSMPPPRIPKIKELIRSVNFKEVKKISEDVLSFSTHAEVEKYLQTHMRTILKNKYDYLVMA